MKFLAFKIYYYFIFILSSYENSSVLIFSIFIVLLITLPVLGFIIMQKIILQKLQDHKKRRTYHMDSSSVTAGSVIF